MEVGFSLSHICVLSEDTRTFRISESYENVCTVDQLKFELCEDSVGKKAANASDNKTSFFLNHQFFVAKL